jgi:predicted MFS family arabinose efflux permease
MFLGEDLLAWLLLAFGGAMFVGNIAALLRPRAEPREDGELTTAPKTRSIAMAILGLVAAVWALFTLIFAG